VHEIHIQVIDHANFHKLQNLKKISSKKSKKKFEILYNSFEFAN